MSTVVGSKQIGAADDVATGESIHTKSSIIGILMLKRRIMRQSEWIGYLPPHILPNRPTPLTACNAKLKQFKLQTKHLCQISDLDWDEEMMLAINAPV